MPIRLTSLQKFVKIGPCLKQNGGGPMGTLGYIIKNAFYPEKSEGILMRLFLYAFRNFGGILWVFLYASIFFIPLQTLVNKYTQSSIILWGLGGLFLTIATLYYRLKWMPNEEEKRENLEQELGKYHKEQIDDFEKFMLKLNSLQVLYDSHNLRKEDTVTKCINNLQEIAMAFRMKYYPKEDDSKWQSQFSPDLLLSSKNGSQQKKPVKNTL